MVTDLLPLLNQDADSNEWNVATFAALMRMLSEKKITSRIAKDILTEVVNGADPEQLVIERGLLQNDSKDSLGGIVTEVIAQNPTVAEDYRNGKEAAMQFLVGQGMKLSKGTANPTLFAEMLKEQLLK